MMYQEVLRDIEGIGLFPAVSLVLFVFVFALVVVYAFRIENDGVRHMAALPLDENQPSGVAPRTRLQVQSLAASPAHSVRVARPRRSLAHQEDRQ